MRMIPLRRAVRGLAVFTLVLLAASACKRDGVTDPGAQPEAPRNFDARSEWVLHGWEAGTLAPIGHPGVVLTWSLPAQWDGEVFRVYARSSGAGQYTAIATVTSCAEGTCSYTDLNVLAGQSYDFIVASVDEASDRETRSESLRVDVPAASSPATPAAPEVVALDGALFLTWPSTGAERYRVFLEQIGSATDFIEIGETDGTAFLDVRADNGITYGYRVAGIDPNGEFSSRSAIGSGIARPDYHAELIWSHNDVPTASGFRFQETETADPIVGGTASGAQWRLEEIGGVLSIVPLGSTAVTAGQFTTSLACGPGAESDCEAITVAPPASSFGTTAVEVRTGNTYVFRVVASDGREHFAKIRVQGTGVNASGESYMVLDWAYQLQPDQPSLNVGT